jgi:hypothetical protein
MQIEFNYIHFIKLAVIILLYYFHIQVRTRSIKVYKAWRIIRIIGILYTIPLMIVNTLVISRAGGRPVPYIWINAVLLSVGK